MNIGQENRWHGLVRMIERMPVLYFFACALLVFALHAPARAQQQKKMDSLKVLLNAANEDSTHVQILFTLGRDYWFMRNLEDAAFYLNQAVAMADKLGYRGYQADAYNLLGNIYMKQEHFELAFHWLEKALAEKNEAYFPLIDETYSKLYYQLGDYQLSLKHALRSAAGFEKSNNPEFKAQSVFAYLMIGEVFNTMGQEERALQYFQRAYYEGRAAGGDWYIKTPMQRIAAYYLSQNELEKAEHLYDTIISIDTDAINLEPTMYSYEGLGNIAMKKLRFDNAIVYYKLALRYAFEKQMAINIENFYTRLGSAFLADQQLDSAHHFLTLAIARSTTSKNYSNLNGAYNFLSILQRQQHNYQAALRSFQLHKSYHDSLLSIEKIKAVNNLEILYRTRQKENEILRLQQAEQEKDFNIKKQNIYIGIGIGMVATLTIILILLSRNHRNKQYLQEEKVRQMERQQQVLSLQAMIQGQENERTRVARDLHDGLGGLFSTVKMYFSTLEHEHATLKTNDLFKKSYSLVDNASVEIRRIAHNMMPEVLMKMGLANAVKDLCDHVSAGRLLVITLETHGMHDRLSTEMEIMLYRIIQELVNNIIKHADATQAIIQFVKDDNRFSVVVEDNGKGFNLHEPDEKVHSGLTAIRNRVNYLNGKLTIDSQPGIGTTVMMDFQIDEVQIKQNGHHRDH